ncbi:MAG: hypothetical protein LCI00_14465 [Chloroflexi bacterium]|nr:hypothetical protein [Chloroflexota bacterium]MCC6892558.1 hypothetical protein [Anaerolineae bacterium]
MDNILVQFLGLMALILAVGGGYWHWIRSRVGLDWQAKGVLLLLVATMAGGLIGSTGWWIDDPSAFSWDLPPLASRMLAAAGWAFGAATFMTLQRPTRRRVRLVLLMLAVYLIPLAVAIVFFHLDRFDPTVPITYAFFILVILLVVPTLWYLIRPPMALADKSHTATSVIVRRWLLVVASVTALWGFALFITDNGPIPLIWVWPGNLLTSRLIAVMLLTIATAALYSLDDADTARVTLVVVLVYGFGAALANLWSVTAGRPVQPLYVLVFGLMGVMSLVLRKFYPS